MSVREEDRRKNSCPSRGLGLAAAAIGVGVGAALYYFFSKRPENPDTEGSTSGNWSCEEPQSLSSGKVESTRISPITTDASICVDVIRSNHCYYMLRNNNNPSDDNIRTEATLMIDDSESSVFNNSFSNDQDDSDKESIVNISESNTSVECMDSEPGSEKITSSDSNENTDSSENESLQESTEEETSDIESIHEPIQEFEEEEELGEELMGNFNPIIQEEEENLESLNTESEYVDALPAHYLDYYATYPFNLHPGMDSSSSDDESVSDLESNSSELELSYGNRSLLELPNWNLLTSNDIVEHNMRINSRPDSPLMRVFPQFSSKFYYKQYREEQMRKEQAFRERRWSLEECAICFDVMLKDQPLMQLPCAHNFHVACIGPWLQERQTCPMCRKAAE